MKFLILLSLFLTQVFTKENYCTNIKIVPRDSIFANIKQKNDIKPSAGRVFWTQTGGISCNFATCKSVVRLERWHDMNDKGFSDIRDNFLIGGDGVVYEGLGWKAKNLRYENFRNDLTIAFIGDFNNRILPQPMSDTALNLINCGIQMRYIDIFYSNYADNDLNCNGTKNGIDERIQTVENYARGGPLINC